MGKKGKTAAAFNGTSGSSELRRLQAGMAERVQTVLQGGMGDQLAELSGRTTERLRRIADGKLPGNITVLARVNDALATLEVVGQAEVANDGVSVSAPAAAL